MLLVFSQNRLNEGSLTCTHNLYYVLCTEIRKLPIWIQFVSGKFVPMKLSRAIASDDSRGGVSNKYFLISAWKHILWVLIRSASMRRF